MFCPNCGKDCGEFKFCPECGTRLCLVVSSVAKGEKENAFPELPLTKKRVRWGVLEFENDSMSVWVKLPMVPPIDVHIPYNEIFDVSYVPATFWLNGFLCVREWKERHIPIPKSHWESTLGNVTTWLEEKDNDDFLRIYEFLKQCAAINAEQRQK